METVYLHIGYHKTATTFLQNSIYPELKNVNFIKKKDIKKEIRKIRVKKLSDGEIGKIREHFNRFDNGQPMLISHEGLSGNPFSVKRTKDSFKVLEDLRRIFPASDYDVHVIVGLREQVDLLTSLYVQHIHQGGILDGPAFIEDCEHKWILRNFNFHRYLTKVEEVFEGSPLYIMIFESFKQQFSEELLKLLNFIGEPEIPSYKDEQHWHNKSFGKLQVAVGRRLNRLFKTTLNQKGRLPIIELPIIGPLAPRRFLQNKVSYALHYQRYQFPQDLQASLKQRYVDGNKKLAEKYNLNLPDRYY